MQRLLSVVSISVAISYCLGYVPEQGKGIASKTENAKSAKPDSILALAVDGPRLGEVGDRLPFTVTVANTGANALHDVLLTVNLDSGLEHDAQVSNLELPLPTLEPGESGKKSIPLYLTGRATGKLNFVVKASADGSNRSLKGDWNGKFPSESRTVEIKPASITRPYPPAPEALSSKAPQPSRAILILRKVKLVDGGEKLQVLQQASYYEPSRSKVEQKEQVTYELRTQEVPVEYALKSIRAFYTDGDPMDAKQLRKALRTAQVAAVGCGSSEVDPECLSALRKNTLVILLPEPPSRVPHNPVAEGTRQPDQMPKVTSGK